LAFSSLQDKVLHFWVNTAFVTDNQIILPKAEIDKAAKDTKVRTIRISLSLSSLWSSSHTACCSCP
jgi:hypothetical protein